MDLETTRHEVARSLRDDFRGAWLRYADHIRAWVVDDPQAAFEELEDFYELEKDLRPDISLLRREVVREIQERERLTLSVLAKRTGLSKSRLAQMVPGPSTTPQEGDRS